jgi:uncharacterized protein (DUF433 family)
LPRVAARKGQEKGKADFPDLTIQDIRACLAFAADRERKLVKVPA